MEAFKKPFILFTALSVILSFSTYSVDSNTDPEVQDMLTTILVERKVASDHRSCEAKKAPLDYKLYYVGTYIAKGCIDVTDKNANAAYGNLNEKVKGHDSGDSEALFDAQKDSEIIARGVTIQNKFCMTMANQFYWLGLRFAYIKSWKLGRMRKRCFKYWQKTIGHTRGSCKAQLKEGYDNFTKIEEYAADPMPSRKREQLVSYLDRAINANKCSPLKVAFQKSFCEKYVNEIEDDIVKCSMSPDKKQTTLLEKLKKLPYNVAMAFFDKMISPATANMDTTYKARSEQIVDTLRKENINSSEYFQDPYSRGALYYDVATHLKSAKNGFDKVAATYASNATQVSNTVNSLAGETKNSKNFVLDGLSRFSDATELSAANINALNALSEKNKRCVYGKKNSGSCVNISANNFGLNNGDIQRLVSGLTENEAATVKKELVSLKTVMAAARPFAKALSNGNPYTKDSMDSANKTQDLMKPIVNQGASMGHKLAGLKGEISLKERKRPIFRKIHSRVKDLIKKDSSLVASLFKNGAEGGDNKDFINANEVENSEITSLDQGDSLSRRDISSQGFAKVDVDVDLDHHGDFNLEGSEDEYEMADIITRREVSLFEAISLRYIRVGWKRLGIHDKK